MYDGVSMASPKIAEYCDSTPSSQISSRNHLFFHFHSNYHASATGFKLEYNPTSKNTCKVLCASKRTRNFGELGNLLLYISQKLKLKLTTTQQFDR